MIAQVHIGKGATTPATDEMRKFVEDALTDGRAQDGVEATISMADPDTGETLVVNLFRDEAALDAFQAYSKQKIAEVEAMGDVEVAPGRIYPDVIALL